MVVLGLVLLVGAGVFAASAITSNTGAVGGDLWGLHISNVSMAGAFLAGVAAGAVALLGLVMLIAGSHRSRRLRRERRELARENARLSQHVDSTDSRADTAGHTRPIKPVAPVNHEVQPVNRDGVPVDREGVPANRNGVPANPEGVPANRNGVPLDDRTDRMRYDREPGYQSPPPPQYDRSAIESERGRGGSGYGTNAPAEPVPGEAPRRRV